jgi:hypothetical protein
MRTTARGGMAQGCMLTGPSETHTHSSLRTLDQLSIERPRPPPRDCVCRRRRRRCSCLLRGGGDVDGVWLMRMTVQLGVILGVWNRMVVLFHGVR